MMRQERLTRWLVGFAAAACVAWPSSAPARERHTVTVSYIVAPERPLPEGLDAVAVIDAGVETRGTHEDERERKWSKIAADMVEAMILTGTQWQQPPLRVVNRRHMKRVLEEQDLRLAGLVDAPTAARAGRLLEVQGLIITRITLDVDTTRSTRQTIDWGGLILDATRGQMSSPDARGAQPVPPARDPRSRRHPQYYRQPAPPAARGGAVIVNPQPTYTRDVEEISRLLTVQCAFSLIDAVTGATILHYAPQPFRKQDRASPNFLFGGLIDDVQLDPADHIIGELVEQACRDFVHMVVPIQVAQTYELTGRRSDAEAGIRALRADNFEAAILHFQESLRNRPDRDETVFALGVTCELIGQHERALRFYREASAMRGVSRSDLPIYLEAKDRLTAHIGRILPPTGRVARTPPPEPAPAPAEPQPAEPAGESAEASNAEP